jgi:hypothetical protein
MAENANPVTDLATLTITKYQTLADDLSAQLDEVMSKFPKPDPARPVTKDFVRARLSAPLEFLGTAIAGVEAAPELQGVRKLDVNTGRDTLQFIEAFRPLVHKVARFNKELRHLVNTKKALLTADAFNVYDVVKSLGRDEQSPAMVALAENLKRDLGRAEAQRRAAAKKAATKATDQKAAAEKAAADKAAAEKAAPPIRAS